MHSEVLEVMKDARAKYGERFATVATIILRIGAWLKSQGLPVEMVAEAVDRVAPTVEEVVDGRPRAFLVVAVDKAGVSLLATEDDAEVQAFSDQVCGRGGAVLGINPALTARELAQGGKPDAVH